MWVLRSLDCCCLIDGADHSSHNQYGGRQQWAGCFFILLFRVANYFEILVADLLPKKVDEYKGTLNSFSQIEGSKLVAGAGFEPTTSGL